MDPLSIAAGVIAVLGAASASGSVVQKFRHLRNAPEELEVLLNEVEALRSVLLIVQASLRGIQDTETYNEVREPLQLLLGRANAAATEFHALLEYQLKRSEELDAKGRMKIDKSNWLRGGPKIERVRQGIRDARDNLHTTLSALSLSSGEQTRQLVVQLQSVYFAEEYTGVARHRHELLESVAGQRHHRGSRLLQSDAAHDQVRVDDQPTTAYKHGGIDSYPALALPLPSGQTGQHMLSIVTTVSSVNCPSLCRCQCHGRSHGRTPQWLKGIVGELLFDYTPVLYAKPCNEVSCRRSPRKSSFTYRFPTWMASRVLIAIGTFGSLTGAGASWSLRMPLVVRDDWRWNTIQEGNVGVVQRLVERRELNPYIVDRYGRGAILQYKQRAIIYRQYDTYEFLVKCFDLKPHLIAEALRFNACRGLQHHLRLGLDPGDMAEQLYFTDLHSRLAFDTTPLTAEEIGRNLHNINTPAAGGQTPLHFACYLDKIQDVRLLLAWNADPNIQDGIGRTPINLVGGNGEAEIVKSLLLAGARVDLEDLGGRTALYFCQSPTAVDALVQAGSNLEHRDLKGWRPMHHLAAENHYDAVQCVIRHGGDVNARDSSNRTPFQAAIIYNALGGMAAFREAFGNLEDSSTSLPTISSCNFMHDTALRAGPELMIELASFTLRNVDPLGEDGDGRTPDFCFYNLRDSNCTLNRSSFEEEENAWIVLMKSICRQNGYIYRPLAEVASRCKKLADVVEVDMTEYGAV